MLRHSSIWEDWKRSCICISHAHKSFCDPSAFLYQEYRDTSKQQEIEQRRQRDNLFPGAKAGTVVADSGVTSPPALQLQLRNSDQSLSLWQNLEAVQASGLLTQLTQKEIIMQEVSNFVRLKCYLDRSTCYYITAPSFASVCEGRLHGQALHCRASSTCSGYHSYIWSHLP